MFRDSMEGLSGRERPMTTYNSFEELAKEFPPNARVATEVGFKEMFSDNAQETLKEWMTTPEGQQALDKLATQMDEAISLAMNLPFPPGTDAERIQQVRSEYLRKAFLKALEEDLPEIDMTDPNINWDEAVKQGREKIGGKATSEEKTPDEKEASDEDEDIQQAA